jgi:hypothetical protein
MTYNQVVTELQTILQSHAMIKTVKFASPLEWLNWDNQPVFPIACFTINQGSLNVGREQVYQINFWFLDKSGPEGEFETDVTSDQHSILADIISKLRSNIQDYGIDDNVSWSAVSEKFEDYLTGVQCTFNLTAVSQFDACSMPTI